MVSLKNFANFVAIGTATNLHAPFTVGNSNADGEIARFQPWSENVSIHSTRSYISLYNSQNADCRWDLSVQDEWPGGGENGFSIRGKHQLDGDTQDRFYISPSAHSVDAVSIFRFYNQNPDNAWEMAIDPANGMSLYSAARGGAGTFDVKRSGLFVDVAGNVAIGTKNPNGYKLAVNGSIHAKELVIDSDSIYWPDYVFSDSHRLMPLAEVEQHIKEHKHLPGVPSAGEVAEKGIGVGQMQATLLAKVEELTLHLIEQEKRLKKLEDENAALRGR